MDKAHKIIKDLKSKNYKPIYYLMGDEPYFIDLIVDYIEHQILDESSKAFDQFVLYGRDVSMQDVVSQAKQYPMMGQMQVIIVKEAKDIENRDPLVSYLDNPQPSTLLVFAHKHGKIAGNTILGKKLNSKAEVLITEKIRDNKVAEWVINYIKDIGYDIDIKAANIIQDFLGNDLTKIINEISKLLISIPKGQKITPDDIEKNIGFSKDFNQFELQKAIANFDVSKAFRIVTHFTKNPKNYPIPLVVANLYNFFSLLLKYHGLPNKSVKDAAVSLKVREFMLYDHVNASKYYPMRKVSQIIEAIKLLDLRFKGVDSGRMTEADMYKDLLNFIFKK